jgi:hypothetical protein
LLPEASFAEKNRSYHAIGLFVIRTVDRDKVLKVRSLRWNR